MKCNRRVASTAFFVAHKADLRIRHVGRGSNVSLTIRLHGWVVVRGGQAVKQIGFGALLFLALIGSARFATAADLEIVKAPPFVSPPPRWSGFYVGINGGGGLGPTSQTLTVVPLITALGVSTTGNYEVGGALLGATLG